MLGELLREAGVGDVDVRARSALEVDGFHDGLIQIEWEEPGAEEDDEAEEEREVPDRRQTSAMVHYLPTLLALATNVKAAQAFCSLAGKRSGAHREERTGREMRPGKEV
jgi:hypothetical protein